MNEAVSKELEDAWQEFQNYGTHDGPCTFGPPCPECGTPSGRCEHHAEHMQRRQSRMETAVAAAVAALQQ